LQADPDHKHCELKVFLCGRDLGLFAVYNRNGSTSHKLFEGHREKRITGYLRMLTSYVCF